MKKSISHNIPILDIYLASYLVIKGFNPDLTLKGTRIVFEFPATEEVYQYSKEYHDNPLVHVLDYTSTIRQLKARMFSMKGLSQKR